MSDMTKHQQHIVLQSLTKTYNNSAVVSNVSMTISEGEFVSLIGPSGSGKTTTLMMIAGFTSVSDGRILLDGRDITHETPQRRDLGVVFQNYAIFPHLSVYENVRFPLRVRKLPAQEMKKRIDWALSTVRLEDYASRMPNQLSGGQLQRVALARAIVYHPRIILMDEPLGALDKNLRYHMQVELKELQRQLGTTVIYVTHDQEEALNMSDRIVVMNNGLVEQIGAPTHVYEKPDTVFVANFLGESNLIPSRSETRDGAVRVVTLKGNHLFDGDISAKADGAMDFNVFVRPEKLRLVDDVAECPVGSTLLRGTVEGISFLGGMYRYTVSVGGDEFVLDVQNASGRKSLNLKDEVRFAIDPQDIKIIGRER